MGGRQGVEYSGPPPTSVWIALAVGMLAFGIAPILVRFGADAAGVTLAAGRMVIATAVLLPFAWGSARRELGNLDAREWAALVAAGVLLGLHFIGWTESIYHTSVASASVLVTTSPLFIAVLGFLFFRERLARATVIAIAIGVLGAVLMAVADRQGGVFPNPALGNSLALSAALFVALYFLIGARLRRRMSLLAYLLPLYGIAALTTTLAMVVSGAGFPPTGTAWIICLLLALGPQLLGHSAFNYAVGYLPPAQVGLMTLAEPVLATIAAVLLFSELPPPIAIGGMALVLCSIAIIVSRRGRPVKTVESLESSASEDL